jgi:hypothetical protein
MAGLAASTAEPAEQAATTVEPVVTMAQPMAEPAERAAMTVQPMAEQAATMPAVTTSQPTAPTMAQPARMQQPTPKDETYFG